MNHYKHTLILFCHAALQLQQFHDIILFIVQFNVNTIVEKYCYGLSFQI